MRQKAETNISDSLDVFPEVNPDVDGCYRFHFLLRKLYLFEASADRFYNKLRIRYSSIAAALDATKEV